MPPLLQLNKEMGNWQMSFRLNSLLVTYRSPPVAWLWKGALLSRPPTTYQFRWTLTPWRPWQCIITFSWRNQMQLQQHSCCVSIPNCQKWAQSGEISEIRHQAHPVVKKQTGEDWETATQDRGVDSSFLWEANFVLFTPCVKRAWKYLWVFVHLLDLKRRLRLNGDIAHV